MLSAIRFRCAHCGARIKAPIELTGQTRDCPQCKRTLVIRWQAPEDEGPMLAASHPDRPIETLGRR